MKLFYKFHSFLKYYIYLKLPLKNDDLSKTQFEEFNIYKMKASYNNSAGI